MSEAMARSRMTVLYHQLIVQTTHHLRRRGLAETLELQERLGQLSADLPPWSDDPVPIPSYPPPYLLLSLRTYPHPFPEVHRGLASVWARVGPPSLLAVTEVWTPGYPAPVEAHLWDPYVLPTRAQWGHPVETLPLCSGPRPERVWVQTHPRTGETYHVCGQLDNGVLCHLLDHPPPALAERWATIRQYLVSTLTGQICPQYLQRLLHYYPAVLCYQHPEQAASGVRVLYSQYRRLSARSFHKTFRDYSQAGEEEAHDILLNLSLGSDSNRAAAGMLYQTLRGVNPRLATRIHQALHPRLQSRLSRYTEGLGLRPSPTLVPTLDSIPIEHRLACLPHLPEAARHYILQASRETEGEAHRKAMVAIDGLLDFPWRPTVDSPETRSDAEMAERIRQTRQVLDREVYGNREAKESILRLVAKWLRNGQSGGMALGLCGPPGVGKTLFAKTLGEALQIPQRTIGLGGMGDAADLIGHSYTYANAQYGAIIRQLIAAGEWRCVLFFDEVDKVSLRSGVNEIGHVLMQITDPEMSVHYQDRFYSSAIEFDLSGVLAVFSYNDQDKLDPVLRNRLVQIDVSGYSVEDKLQISRTHLLPRLLGEVRLSEQVTFPTRVLQYLIRHYSREGGIRSLTRILEHLILDINLRLCEGESEESVVVTRALCEQLLPASRQSSSVLDGEARVGRSYAMYATPTGEGGVISLQVSAPAGRSRESEITLTGSLGQVMQEAALCSWTAAISLLQPRVQARVRQRLPDGIHLHAGQSACPKDGPSAGLACLMAILSLSLELPLAPRVAFTGEIDLHGYVHPVGGVPEKLAGAAREGVETVYVPVGNLQDCREYTLAHQDSQLLIRTLHHVSEIWSGEDGDGVLEPRRWRKLTLTVDSIPRHSAAS